jgi:hypothetical protein
MDVPSTFKERPMSRRYVRLTSFEARSLLLIASVTLGVAGNAYAQSTAAPAKPAATDTEITAAFTKADKNSDGKLSHPAGPGRQVRQRRHRQGRHDQRHRVQQGHEDVMSRVGAVPRALFAAGRPVYTAG